MCAEFFLVEIKAQRDKGGERILLGENTGGGAVMLRPIRGSVFWSSDFNWTPFNLQMYR
jgi:hypothetical protein